jgi:hypothetical protein
LYRAPRRGVKQLPKIDFGPRGRPVRRTTAGAFFGPARDAEVRRAPPLEAAAVSENGWRVAIFSFAERNCCPKMPYLCSSSAAPSCSKAANSLSARARARSVEPQKAQVSTMPNTRSAACATGQMEPAPGGAAEWCRRAALLPWRNRSRGLIRHVCCVDAWRLHSRRHGHRRPSNSWSNRRYGTAALSHPAQDLRIRQLYVSGSASLRSSAYMHG